MTAKPNWTPTIIQQLDFARRDLAMRERQLSDAYTTLQEMLAVLKALRGLPEATTAAARAGIFDQWQAVIAKADKP